jgi:hypothetical protein
LEFGINIGFVGIEKLYKKISNSLTFLLVQRQKLEPTIVQVFSNQRQNFGNFWPSFFFSALFPESRKNVASGPHPATTQRLPGDEAIVDLLKRFQKGAPRKHKYATFLNNRCFKITV